MSKVVEKLVDVVGDIVGAVLGGVIDMEDASATSVEDRGTELRLNADTKNSIPVHYGQYAHFGMLTYFEKSTDAQTAWAVITLGESVTSIDTIIWQDVTLSLDTNGNVTGGTEINGASNDRYNGNVRILRYPLGGRSTFLEGVSNSKWTANHKMTGLAYIVVQYQYSSEKQIGDLGQIRIIGVGKTNNPVSAVQDQLTASASSYGLGLSTSDLNTASFAAGVAYCNELINRTTGMVVTATGNNIAKRYTVNGSVDTSANMLDRINQLLAGCNCSLSWLDGSYGIFINRTDDNANRFTIDESNIIRNSISITEVGSDNVLNEIKVVYGRDPANNYQNNELILKTPNSARFPNELDNQEEIKLDFTNNYIEAERSATIKLNASRQQLTVNLFANIEAYPLESGDVINIVYSDFGWNPKLFRVVRIIQKEENSALTYDITAIEYTASAYTDRVIATVDAAPNLTLPNATVIAAVTDLSNPASNPTAAVPNFSLSWTAPIGLVESFNLFFSSGTVFSSSDLLRTFTIPGRIYTAGDTVTEVITGVPPGTYNFWIQANNEVAVSAASNRINIAWDPSVTANVDSLNPRFSKNVLTLTKNENNAFSLASGSVDFSIFVGSRRINLRVGHTDAVLSAGEWRFVSVVGSTGINLSIATQDTAGDVVGFLITSVASTFAGGTITLTWRFRQTDNTVIEVRSQLDVAVSIAGAAADNNNWIFIVVPLSATNVPTPAASSGVPTVAVVIDSTNYSWLDTPPANPSGAIWASLGTQSSGQGNFVWGTPERLTGSTGQSSRLDIAYATNLPEQQTITASGTRSNLVVTGGDNAALNIAFSNNFFPGFANTERARVISRAISAGTFLVGGNIPYDGGTAATGTVVGTSPRSRHAATIGITAEGTNEALVSPPYAGGIGTFNYWVVNGTGQIAVFFSAVFSNTNDIPASGLMTVYDIVGATASITNNRFTLPGANILQPLGVAVGFNEVGVLPITKITARDSMGVWWEFNRGAFQSTGTTTSGGSSSLYAFTFRKVQGFAVSLAFTSSKFLNLAGNGIRINRSNLANTLLPFSGNSGFAASANTWSYSRNARGFSGYNIDIDIDNAVYSAAPISGTFVATDTAATALVKIGNAIAALASAITFDGTTTVLSGGITSISIDLGTVTPIRPSVSVGVGSGSFVNPFISLSGQSIYLVRDYNGNDVVCFSSSVSSPTDSDRDAIISTILDAISDNVQNPVNFIARRSGRQIIIEADAIGQVAGTWSIAVNHGDGGGNIGFATVVVNREGSAIFTSSSFPTGRIVDNNYFPAVTGVHNFIGERLTVWGDDDEPAVSRNTADYAFSRLR